MKKIIFILLITIPGFISCDDFLNLSPEYQINEVSYYQTENDFETAVTGIYNTLQSMHNREVLLGPAELLTDNTEINSYVYDPVMMEYDYAEITSSNVYINNLWTYCFTVIAYSNNILDRVDDIDMSGIKQDRFKGEALFLRAYCYFYLVRLYGDVPLVDVAFRSPNEIFTFDMTRKPVADVYALIESDLQNAATLLSGQTMPKGRASAGAAKALLGKVYLTEKKYADAATTLKGVIDLNTYSLVDDYGSLFDGSNERSGESIFEIEYLSGNLGEGNYFSTAFTPGLFGIAIFPNNMSGSGSMCPTRGLFNAYEEGDLRKATSMVDSVKLTNGTYQRTLCGLKFVDFSTGTSGDGGINFTSLRYADVLLMYAEALNETSQTTTAHNYLNMVRDRAGLDGLSGLSKADFALALERERRVEFCWEGQRWFDLVRTGRAKTVLNAYFTGTGSSYSIEDHELLMPIPADEIEIDPRLKQNPEY